MRGKCGIKTLYQKSGCDDCGWHARLYLLYYQYVKDPWFLDCAKQMIDKAADRWLDNSLGGGMWYENTRKWKSLYQIAVVMACLDIFEYTGEKRYFLLAMECYYWMETHLKWKAGIYWTDLNCSGLPGQKEPAIAEYREDPSLVGDPGSLSFLGGNMAMGAIHARLHRISGLEVYRMRLEELCSGLIEIYIRDGCFINDRDAWTDTYCLGEWTREVAVLPEVDCETADVASKVSDIVRGLKNYLGNPFRPDWSSPSTHLTYGYWVGATPDGRGSREMMGYGIDPLFGTADSGLGFRTLSTMQLPFEKMCGGCASHFGIDPKFFTAGDYAGKGVQFYRRVLKPLFFNPENPRRAPFYLYVNVTTADTLRKVLANPRKYAPNGVYIMRIHGTFVNFLDLSPAIQEDIIKRLDPGSTSC